ncbi:hemicentin-1 [Eurytemora carolleeae]|uniref:hemicentin-1 n=1 Tax=Eurytemora carolleeae TaxID=1294199 RepID=UPI000C783734|nr:hemicentin-1 [Eurytemora carolleeae]|eukprot:XP_023326830.1 hemicentin-1-like [Eurytemora affinis]
MVQAIINLVVKQSLFAAEKFSDQKESFQRFEYSLLLQVSSGSSITSRLELPVLRREDTRSLVSCFTNNNNISQQLSANTTINVLVPPVSVRIEEKRKKLVDGKIYLFNCAAEDFYPSIEYTWFLNQEILPHSKPTKGSNLSTLEIELTRHQHGSILSCRAFNPEIPDVSLQDSLVLDIYYKPVLKLELGAGLNLHNIRQSSDIYLECTADSRPALQHVRWKKDGFDITEEKKKGRLVSRTSLVIQNISSSESGRYCCTGENSEGETSSNIITVDVKFSPECSEQPENILLQKKASIQVTCGMSSNPGVEKFSWKFKNEKFEVDIPESLYTVHENTSVLKYFAHSDRDYGTLLCYASNIIGPQTKPCIFRIIQPGSGSLVIVCSTKLVSPVSVLVNCQNTKEDGLYNLQVSRLGNPVLLERNITSLKGNFKVFGLLPGSSYQARVDYLDGNNERWTSLLNFTTIELDKSIPIQDSLQESLPSVLYNV